MGNVLVYKLENVQIVESDILGKKERSFKTRSKEFPQSYKHRNQNSKFAQHLQEYSFTRPMEDVMEIVKVVRKEKFTNELEKFYI
jgi:hypothetical protein